MLVRRIGVAVALIAAFAVASALVLRFLPEPLRPIDYMLAGSLATMAMLGIVFCAMGEWGRVPRSAQRESRDDAR